MSIPVLWDGALFFGSCDKFHVTALHLVHLPTEFTNTAISDFGILGYKILICHSNVLFSFCFSLKSCCFCLQGTHHTFHEQKAREKVKMSQKMWKIWAKWSENQHNSNENKRWAEPRGQQSITPKKARGARDPIFGRILVFYHPLKTQTQKIQTIPSTPPNSTGVVQRYERRTWSIILMKTEKTFSLYFPLKKKRKCPLVTWTCVLN